MKTVSEINSVKKPKIRALSKEKIKLLLEAGAKSAWYLEIQLGLFCGLRKGEILGLKFSLIKNMQGKNTRTMDMSAAGIMVGLIH